MIQKVQGEQPFQVLATNFSIGPSNEGYTLQISADGNNYTNLFSVDANTTRMVTAVANGSFYRMLGNNSEVAVNWRTQCNDGGSGGSGSGGTDTGTVQTMINQSLSAYTANLEEGEPIVGMAKQLYSPDGVTTEGAFTYRTTGGDKDVSTGNAELRKVEGNSIYPEAQYNDSAALERAGSGVTGFTYDIEWGDRSEWVTVEGGSNFNVQQARQKVEGDTDWYPGINYDGGGDYANLHWAGYDYYLSSWENVEQIDDNNWTWAYGTIHFDGEYVIFTVTTDGHYISSFTDGNGGDIYQTNVIPNDIPAGVSTYVFAQNESNAEGSWTPSLPQALQNMQIDGSDYVPQDGDEITITRNVSRQGRAQFSTPSTFVALGLNSFCKDSATTISDFSEDNGVYTVTVYAVAGLEAGYVVYDQNSGITAAGIGSGKTDEMDSATTVYGEALSVVYPTTAKPYIIVTTTDIDGLCIHPRWSGYNDLVYEPYEESKVNNLLGLVTLCPMWSVGNVRNIIDIENGQIIRNIGSEDYSAARVNELLASGYTLGVDFDFDSALIYKVLDTPVVSSISFDGEYKANDFGVEYFVDENGIIPTPVFAETYYMQNLVDKLRRMEGLVHLDSLSGTGSENTLYECNDKLFMWSDEGGVVAEWTSTPQTTSSDDGADENIGYGLAFSYIPNGQTILGFRSRFGGNNYRTIEMSGDTLVLVYNGDIINTCSIGETKDFESDSSSRKIRVKYDKFHIGINIGTYVEIDSSTLWDGNVDGGHFVMVDHYNYPLTNAHTGLLKTNEKGQVIGRGKNCDFRWVRFNSTGFTSYATLYFERNRNMPGYWYFPTQGGTAGQMLISAGDNAEPTWSNWIKSVQITSDAYDALVQAGTTDPNTLYLLID